MRLEVPCASKFRAFRSSVRFEVPCASKFSAFRSSVRFEVPCASKFRVGTMFPLPPTNNTIVEDKLKQMNNFVIYLYKNSAVPFNLSHDEAVGLKSLHRKKSKLLFSVSDKGREFVVMNQGIQCDLTAQCKRIHIFIAQFAIFAFSKRLMGVDS